MSFALVHHNKNKTADSKTSMAPAKPSPHHHINNLAMDSDDSIIHLERTIGNQAVQRLMSTNVPFNFAKIGIFQPKLKVNQPGDAYEQEADRVADQVMRMPVSDSASRMTNAKETIDRKCSVCEMNKEDSNEQELNISRDILTTANLETTDKTANEISIVRSSSGLSLDPSIRHYMESRFGFDFGRVRIHADDNAARSAESINARAYTVRNDIVFGHGQYSPHTKPGQHLIAHELSHTIQQNTSGNSPIVQRQPGPPNTAKAGKELFWKLLALREAMLRGNSEAGLTWNREMNRFSPDQRPPITNHIDSQLRNLSKNDRGTLYNYAVQGESGRALPTSAAGHRTGDKMVRSGFSASPSSGVNDPRNFAVEFRSDNSGRGAGIERPVTRNFQDIKGSGVSDDDAKRQAVERLRNAKAARSPSQRPEQIPLPPDPLRTQAPVVSPGSTSLKSRAKAAVAGGAVLALEGAHKGLDLIIDFQNRNAMETALSKMEVRINEIRAQPNMGVLLIYCFTDLYGGGPTFSHLDIEAGRAKDEAWDKWKRKPSFIPYTTSIHFIDPAEPTGVEPPGWDKVAVATFNDPSSIRFEKVGFKEWSIVGDSGLYLPIRSLNTPGSLKFSPSAGKLFEFFVLQMPSKISSRDVSITNAIVPIGSDTINYEDVVTVSEKGDKGERTTVPAIMIEDEPIVAVVAANEFTRAIFNKLDIFAIGDKGNNLKLSNKAEIRWLKPSQVRVLKRL